MVVLESEKFTFLLHKMKLRQKNRVGVEMLARPH